MKRFTIHAPSLAAGGLVAAALSLTLGAAQVTVTPAGPQAQAPAASPTMLANYPAADQIIFLQAGDPTYTVPAGKVLVLCTLGDSAFNEPQILINGVPWGWQGAAYIHRTFIPGRTVVSGSIIEMVADSYVSGYLADA
ncbi:MAG: hypothetical protein VX015_03275 [Planctomycetota bacterium]|nr:hypothetical protein [Planctomycetota bacterium]